jgi:hypothetical protein
MAVPHEPVAHPRGGVGEEAGDRGRVRGDIDHVLIGPPEVVTVNRKHHRGGRLALDGEQLVLGGRPTEYVPKVPPGGERAAELSAPGRRPRPSSSGAAWPSGWPSRCLRSAHRQSMPLADPRPPRTERRTDITTPTPSAVHTFLQDRQPNDHGSQLSVRRRSGADARRGPAVRQLSRTIEAARCSARLAQSVAMRTGRGTSSADCGACHPLPGPAPITG